MKRHLATYAWPLAINAAVAIIAYCITAYITSDAAQRAARYYDPAHDELYIRAMSASVRLASDHSNIAIFVALFAAGILCMILLLAAAPRLLHWLGLSSPATRRSRLAG